MEPPDGGDCDKTKSAAASAAAVDAAGDDAVGEIFLRLPDTASLARAALACKRWRRVASDPALLRRFHSLHGPPLLGFVMLGARGCEGPGHMLLPASSDNPHMAAVTAAADYRIRDFAAKYPRSSASIDGRWEVRGCDGGRILLSHRVSLCDELAVYDPISRTVELIQGPWKAGIFFAEFFGAHYVLVAGEDASSFRVFDVHFDYLHYHLCGGGTCSFRAVLFSSRTGEWASLPDPSLTVPGQWKMRDGMRAGRFAYWKSHADPKRSSHIQAEGTLVLDTTTMEWTLIELPFPAKESYCVADIPEHGGLCFVASKEDCLQLWVRNSDGWVIEKQVLLREEFAVLRNLLHDDCHALSNMKGAFLRRDFAMLNKLRHEWVKRVRILDVKDGYVYMEFWCVRSMPQCYLLVLHWQTMNLRVLANYTNGEYRGPAFPFFMTWAPPFLSPAIAEVSSSR